MTFKKIKSSIAPFDDLFQGLYLDRPTLLSGKRKSGVSTIAFRFLSHVVKIGEKLLLFTDQSPDHVSLDVYGLGNDVSDAIKDEQLSIVPYDRQLPLLPFPEALDELRTLITDRHYSFVIFDPVIPWLAAPAEQLDDRLHAFFDLLAETAVTSILILRHPVSPLARRLFDAVAQRCAICLNVTHPIGGPHALEVSKYMGAPPDKCPVVIQLASGVPGGQSFQPIQKDSQNLQALHERTQRISVNIPPYPHSAPLPTASNGGVGYPGTYPGVGQPQTRVGQPQARNGAGPKRPGNPAVAPLPLPLPPTAPHMPTHTPAQNPAPAAQKAPPAAPRAPAAAPRAPAATQRAPAAAPASGLPPTTGLPPTAPRPQPPAPKPPAPPTPPPPPPPPPPAESKPQDPKSVTRLISLVHLLDDPDVSPRRIAATTPPRRAASHGIRFADAATPDAPPKAPKPKPAQPDAAAPDASDPKAHTIRFSDIIQ